PGRTIHEQDVNEAAVVAARGDGGVGGGGASLFSRSVIDVETRPAGLVRDKRIGRERRREAGLVHAPLHPLRMRIDRIKLAAGTQAPDRIRRIGGSGSRRRRAFDVWLKRLHLRESHGVTESIAE